SFDLTLSGRLYGVDGSCNVDMIDLHTGTRTSLPVADPRRACMALAAHTDDDLYVATYDDGVYHWDGQASSRVVGNGFNQSFVTRDGADAIIVYTSSMTRYDLVNHTATGLPHYGDRDADGDTIDVVYDDLGPSYTLWIGVGSQGLPLPPESPFNVTR